MRKTYYECKMFMSLNLCFTEEVYCYEFVSLIYNGMRVQCAYTQCILKKKNKKNYPITFDYYYRL